MKRDFAETIIASALALVIIAVIAGAVSMVKNKDQADALIGVIGLLACLGGVGLACLEWRKGPPWNFVLTLILLGTPVSAQESTYQMRCPGDCGPSAIAFVTGIDQDRVESVMDWQHHHSLGGIREDLQDSPAAHKLAVLKLGYRYRVRSCWEITSGRATPEKTIILLSPNARHPYISRHWVVLAPPGGRYVRVHWGDGSIRELHDFEEQFRRGKPQCAYEVIPGPGGKATWLNRAWDWLMKKLN